MPESRVVLSNRAATYLVVVPEVLIAQDLKLTITDYDAGAQVIQATTVADAEIALTGVKALAVAFLADQPNNFANSPLARAIARRGGRVVLLGEGAKTTGPTDHWGVLQMPFSTAAVLALLAL